MNKVILMGRLTRDPEVRYSQGATATAIARFSMAVDRRFKRDGEPDADFINCVAFGRTGEFIERYGHKGTKFVVEGRIQTGSYTNKDGQRVYTTDVVAENVEFALPLRSVHHIFSWLSPYCWRSDRSSPEHLEEPLYRCHGRP